MSKYAKGGKLKMFAKIGSAFFLPTVLVGVVLRFARSKIEHPGGGAWIPPLIILIGVYCLYMMEFGSIVQYVLQSERKD